MVIQESGGILDAIKHLDMYKENIFDKLTVLEIYGKLNDHFFYMYFILAINNFQFIYVISHH